MVEANQIVQPQDMRKPNTGDEYLDMIIERTNVKFLETNAQFDLLEKPVIDRINQLSDFKGLVSKKILDVY